MLVATGLTGAATSQPITVNVSQIQSSDVLADGDLVVDDVDTARQPVNAMGNGYTAQTQTGQLTVDSGQSLDGDVAATNRLQVDTYAYAADQRATATGNAGQADSLGYGDMRLTSDQRQGAAGVTARNALEAPDAQVDNIDAGAQAIGNSQAFSQAGAASQVQVTQDNQGLVQADGEYVFRHSTGSAAFTASAIANNVTGAGVDGASQDVAVVQSMSGARTQASQYVAAANAQEINAVSTAVANNVSVSNGDNPLSVTARQTNNAYLRAESSVYAYDFGAATAQATGVANSSVIGQFGPEIAVDIDQLNSSGVEVLASFEGGRGYDGYASATAMGNASTAYACTTCGVARMNVASSQTNTGPVTARSSVTVSGENRSVSNTVTAVGNSATYYVSAGSSD